MKTWFITGSSSGIGKGIAKAVLEKGDNAGHGYRAAVEEGEESEKGTKGQENGVSGAVRSRFLQASPSRRHGPPQRFSIPAFPCARRDPAPFPS